MVKIFLCVFYASQVLSLNAYCITLGHSTYLLSNTVQGRTAGMGGTTTAVQDGLGSAIFNPACMEFYRYPQSFHLACFLNPVGGAAAIKDRNKLTIQKEFDSVDWVNLTGIFIKGLAVSSRSFSAALLLSEQLSVPPPPKNKLNILSTEDLLDFNYNVLATHLALAKQVSIGASGYLFNELNGEKMQRVFGVSYGVFLQPNNKISVGVVYIDIPQKASFQFLTLNRIIDETINVGISYRPFSALLLAADVRNVAEEEQAVTREVHVGMELTPFHSIALRTGFYKDKLTKIDILTGGIGLLNSASIRSTEGQFIFPEFVLNYGFQVEKAPSALNFNHVLTLLLRL